MILSGVQLHRGKGMSLDYDKIQAQEESPQTSMSSYSDLFAALAFVFLFLYVMSTLQLSLQSISSSLEMNKYTAQLKEYEIPDAADNPENAATEEIDYRKAMKKLAAMEKKTKAAAETFYNQVAAFREQEEELVNNYQTIVNHVQKKNANLEVALQQTEKDLKEQQSKYKDLITQKDLSYKANIASAQKTIGSQRQKLEVLTRISEDMATEKDRLDKDYRKLQAQVKHNAVKLEELENERNRKEAELAKMAASEQDLQTELQESLAQIEQLEKIKQDTLAEKKIAEDAHHRLEKQLKKSTAKLETISQQKDTNKGEKAKLQKDNQALQRQLAESEAALKKLSAASRAKIAEKEQLAGTNKKLIKNLNKVKSELSNLARGKAKASAEKDQLASMQKSLLNDLNKTKAQLADIAKGRAESDAEKDKLADAHELLLSELGSAKEKLAELQAEKAIGDEEKAQLLAAQQKLMDDYNTTVGKLSALESDKKISDDEKGKLRTEKLKLEEELDKNKDQLDELEKAKADVDIQKDTMIADLRNLEDKLGDYKAKEHLRKNIIDNLKDNFKRHNIDAQINEGTGEVVLPFDKAYFDLGSSDLKGDMKSYLKKIMPVYSDSIFGEDTIYKYIQSIEIIGYASPIYQGRYVNPHNLSKQNQQALNYNMNLSYRRAHSIFKYILNQQNIRYQHQKDLMLYLKVTGRSYLESTPLAELPDGEMEYEEFCEKYDCEKLQSAVIRFNLTK
ncbi:MAG: hypothetical protein HKM93_06640 [Desulfobacteraceae bacterium]|nr:hypothetical protein [Desulfobacteraceae bacterium]